MILHEIVLRSVGPFRNGVRLGPFSRGLNIIAAPNETGKTTAMRAAARALFDRHTTKADELKSLQPAGTELAPQIAVDFETAQGRFRIEKTFLLSPTSVLQQRHGENWETIADGDAADRKVQELLNSSLPGRGGTKPEHWGFLGFLWARQGEVAAWPSLDDEAVGHKIRARLVRVELDPVIERLRERLLETSDAIFTSTGRPKANGTLDLAENELASINAALAAVRQTRLEIESFQQRHQQAAAMVAQLERELAERKGAAQKLAELAAAAGRLQGELDARQKELTAAQEKLHVVSRDTEMLAARQMALTAARNALNASEELTRQADARLVTIRGKIDAQQAARPEQEKKLGELRRDHQRIQSLLKLRQAEAHAEALSIQRTRAEGSAAAISELADKLTRLPALTGARVNQLQEFSDRVTALRARVDCCGGCGYPAEKISA
ncbi:MAG TPA: AAA family ATPase [Terrimicrobiaceae bacterium]|nr:AAA family ATPase [Terrimicrobiaceae bacterium]